MKWHEEPDLSILHPLPDAVPRAPFDACNERAVVDDAIEDLSDRVCTCMSRAVLRDGALPGAGTHLGCGARCL